MNFQKMVEDFQNIHHIGWKETTDLPYLIIALMGELGEFSDTWKKWQRYLRNWKGKKTNDTEAIHVFREEIADIQIYLCLIASLLQIDIKTELEKKMEQLVERYNDPK